MTTGRKNGGLLLASLVLALLAFIPSQAYAHPGHGHDAVKADPATVIPAIIASETSGTRSGGQTDVRHPGWQDLQAPLDLSFNTSPVNAKGCTGGCCQSAGPHCCPAFVSTDPGVIDAPIRTLTFARLVDKGAGINPGALSKPPKSLV